MRWILCVGMGRAKKQLVRNRSLEGEVLIDVALADEARTRNLRLPWPLTSRQSIGRASSIAFYMY